MIHNTYLNIAYRKIKSRKYEGFLLVYKQLITDKVIRGALI